MLLENTEWNLLSCLFQPRWEGYLLKDKYGRMYLDMDSAVLIAIFDQLKEATITGDTLFPKVKCKDYKEMLQYFYFSSDLIDESDVWKLYGLEQSQVKDLQSPTVLKSLCGIIKNKYSQHVHSICSLTPIFRAKRDSVSQWFNGRSKFNTAEDNIVCFVEDNSGHLQRVVIGYTFKNAWIFECKSDQTFRLVNKYSPLIWYYGGSNRSICFLNSALELQMMMKLEISKNLLCSLSDSYSYSSFNNWSVVEVYFIQFDNNYNIMTALKKARTQLYHQLFPPSSTSNTNNTATTTTTTTSTVLPAYSTQTITTNESIPCNKKQPQFDREGKGLTNDEEPTKQIVSRAKRRLLGEIDKMVELQDDLEVCYDVMLEEEKQLLMELIFIEQYLSRQHESMTGAPLCRW